MGKASPSVGKPSRHAASQGRDPVALDLLQQGSGPRILEKQRSMVGHHRVAVERQFTIPDHPPELAQQRGEVLGGVAPGGRGMATRRTVAGPSSACAQGLSAPVPCRPFPAEAGARRRINHLPRNWCPLAFAPAQPSSLSTGAKASWRARHRTRAPSKMAEASPCPSR